MKRTEELLTRLYSVEGNQLKIGEFSVEQIIEKYNSPLYVYDVEIIKKIYQSIIENLPLGIEIFYSIKANPSLAVCNLFHQLGAGAEVASKGELLLAKKAGFSCDKIVFAGPGKTKEELKIAIEDKILMINVESFQEMEDIVKICKNNNFTANVSIRVNPKINVTNSQMPMGGGSQKFGVDEDQLEDLLVLVMNNKKFLTFKGIHIYVGGQIFNTDSILENFKYILLIAKKIQAKFPNITVAIIDFGGGFGVPYYKTEKEFNLAVFKEGFNHIIKEIREKNDFKNTKIIIELGRFLVAESGVYLTKVLYTKKSNDRLYVIVDGGMHHNCIGTGNMGQRVPKRFPLCVANKIGFSEKIKVNIVGPLCTPLDSFGNAFESPEIERGDIIAIFQMGAYGLSASMTNFLSHPVCGEVMVEADHCEIIRKVRGVEDILTDQRLFKNSSQIY